MTRLAFPFKRHSGNMHAVWTTRQEATTVQASAVVSLLPEDGENLVLARGNVLQVYASGVPLRLRFSISMATTIEDVARVRRPGMLDALALTFSRSKIAIIAYSRKHHELLTIGLYNFDAVHPATTGMHQSPFHPLLAVDPLGQCAAVVVSETAIAIVPAEAMTNARSLDGSQSKAVGSFQPRDDASVFISDVGSLGIHRLASMVFLEGFNDPTLLILHEPGHSWEGRTAVAQQTKQLSTLTVHLGRKNVSVIGASELLPLSTHSILPLPKPVGGVLAFASNAIYHYAQAVDFVMTLNEFGERDVAYRVAPVQSRTPFSLNNTRACLLSPSKALLNDDAGQLRILHLVHRKDSLLDLRFESVQPLPRPSCMLRLGSYIVIGSGVSDTLIVSIEAEAVAVDEEPAMEVEEADAMELELFGRALVADRTLAEGETETAEAQHELSIVDTLTSLSPLPAFAAGHNHIDETGQRDADMRGEDAFVDLVCASGEGSSGSLMVAHQGTRPVTRHAFDFGEAALGSWTASFGGVSTYLLIAFASKTAVLSCRTELKEETSAGAMFYTSGPTLAFGNLLGDELMVQVYSYGLRLLQLNPTSGILQLLQEVTIVGEIKEACICDPFVVVRLEGGSVQAMHLHDKRFSTQAPQLFEPRTPLGEGNTGATALCLFRDTASELLSPNATRRDEPQQTDTTDLYDALFAGESHDVVMEGVEEGDEERLEEMEEKEAAVYCFISRADGRLELYRLPDFELVYWCSSFAAGFDRYDNVLWNPEHINHRFDERHVAELSIGRLDPDNPHADPWLLALLSSGDLLVYRCFASETAPGSVPLRLKKHQHQLITRETEPTETRRLHAFSDVGGHTGFYILGQRPCWVFGVRGYWASHWEAFKDGPLLDTPLAAFSALHSQLCYRGYVVFQGNLMLVRQLPDADRVHTSLDLQTVRIPVEKRVHAVCYSPSSLTYSIVVSEPVEGFSMEEPSDRGLPVFDAHYAIQLYTADSFIHVDTFSEFNEDHILCVSAVKLLTFTRSIDLSKPEYYRRARPFLAVGTTELPGEEGLAYGRTMLFEIYDTSPSDASGRGIRYKGPIAEVKSKGPVSQVRDVNGVLLCAIGSRILMYRWTGNTLIGCAFFDAHVYITSLSTMKNFIVYGDIHKSSSLLYWDPFLRQIVFLGKDHEHVNVAANDMLVHEDKMLIAAADLHGNLRTMSYSPDHPSSLDGEKLVPRGDFNTGGLRISAMTRFKSRGDAVAYSILASTLEGGFGQVVYIPERLYRRLYSLHTQMTYRLRHPCGLNPQLAKRYDPKDEKRPGGALKDVLDGDLVRQFPHLDLNEQKKLARVIGTTPDVIIDNLLRLDLETSFT